MTWFHIQGLGRKDGGHPIVDQVFAADGAMNTAAFVALLTDDASLRIGSHPALQGKAAITEAVNGVFAMMRSGLEHRLIEMWGTDDVLVYEAEVTYRLKDGRDLVLPYTNVLRLADTGRVADYRIYIDLAPLNS